MSYSSEVLADSPTIYLRLDETSGTSATDSSGNSNTGTYSGQYTLNQTSIVGSDLTGKSVRMSNSSGTSGQIQIPVVTLGMTWTIEMVIKPVSGDGTSGEQTLFIARSGSNLNNAIWIVYDNGGQRVLMYGSISDGSDCYSGVWVGSVAPNVVTHVAAVLDGSAARLYINGVEGASDESLNGTISITSSTTDGAFAFGAPFSGSYPNIFGGYLDELAVYSGAYLSSARVAAHYAALAAPVSAQGFFAAYYTRHEACYIFPRERTEALKMAGIRLMAATSEIALSSGTAKTVIQLVAPTNQRLKLKRWGVFFDASSPSLEPVQVVLMRQTTAGTMSSLTPTKLGVYTETIQSSAQHTATAEPTSGDILDIAEVHPQSGYEVIFPLGDELDVPGGGRVGLVITAPAGVNVRAKLGYEE